MFLFPNQWKECIICWTDCKALLCGFEQWTWRKLTWAGIFKFFFYKYILEMFNSVFFFLQRVKGFTHCSLFYVQILCTSFFVCLFLSYFHTQNSVVGLFWNKLDFSEILSREWRHQPIMMCEMSHLMRMLDLLNAKIPVLYDKGNKIIKTLVTKVTQVEWPWFLPPQTNCCKYAICQWGPETAPCICAVFKSIDYTGINSHFTWQWELLFCCLFCCSSSALIG